ncbi:MAG: DUF4282 domain-containing protein [bacterium]
MLNDFIKFDKLITPSIIKVIFWIGIAITIISGLVAMISGIASTYGGGGQVLMGLVTIIIGPLFVRVYCEILIIIFKINENLVNINEKLDKE